MVLPWDHGTLSHHLWKSSYGYLFFVRQSFFSLLELRQRVTWQTYKVSFFSGPCFFVQREVWVLHLQPLEGVIFSSFFSSVSNFPNFIFPCCLFSAVASAVPRGHTYIKLWGWMTLNTMMNGWGSPSVKNKEWMKS